MQKNIRFKIPKNALEKSAAKEVCRIAESGGKIGVACSGGADSVCALMWVAGVFSKNKKNVYVLHFNHRERAAADSDAEFVGAVAKKLGANFILGKAETPPKKITEDSLRRLRLGFVAEQSAELGLSAVVQGHNSGDVAETLVMRLMRGAGTAGMSAPRPVSHFRGAVLVRPLLRLSKTDIKNLLRDAKIEWREDETNASADFLRNRLRSEIIPAVDALCAGGFSSSALRSRAQFQEDSDFIEKVFERALAEANPNLEVSPSHLPPKVLRLPDGLARESPILRRAATKLLALNSLAAEVRAGCVDAFVSDAAESGFARASVGMGLEMFFSEGELRIESAREDSEWSTVLKSGKNRLPNGEMLRVEKISLTRARFESIKNGENDDNVRAYIDLSATGGLVDGALVARTRRPGDCYVPLGSHSSKKLKEMFNAKKIPIWKRKAAFVVCNAGNNILWSPGLPPSELFKVENSRSVIELTFENF